MARCIAALSLSLATLFSIGSPARADCEHWSDWAYDYNCSDEGVAVATITNFAGEKYEVRCGLERYNCSSTGTSSQDFVWYAHGPVCSATEGVAVQFIASLINGNTNERKTEDYTFTPDDTGLCANHSKYADYPWKYNVIGCRVGFNCR